ncbi:hypothetical protein RB653_006935 [Dictyostelium firmibasis]|uniref:Uncharacterized protein n=1 Tax=Dictyostelium firmibasis TaxID=79012 RepID=A0AAN7TTT3_9MYCE
MKLILLLIFLVFIKLISSQQNIQEEEQQNHLIVLYSNQEGAIDYVYSKVKEVKDDDINNNNTNNNNNGSNNNNNNNNNNNKNKEGNNNKYHLEGGEISTDMIMLAANQSLGYFNNGEQKYFTIQVISNINFKLYCYDIYESIQQPLGLFSKSYSFRAINGEYIKFKVENVDQNDGYVKIYIKRPSFYPTTNSTDPLIIPLNQIDVIPSDDLKFFNDHPISNNNKNNNKNNNNNNNNNNKNTNNNDKNNNINSDGSDSINSFDDYQSSETYQSDSIENFSKSEIDNLNEIPIRGIDQFSLGSVNTNFDGGDDDENTGVRNEFFEINDIVDFSEINSSNYIKINYISFVISFIFVVLVFNL